MTDVAPQPSGSKSKSLITVVAPARNAAHFYAPWLQSIEAQDYENLEVILVDDGSDDQESHSSLLSLTRTAPAFLRYLRQENGGPASARNLAIRESHGDYVAFLDLDDRWARGNLNRLATVLDRDPDAGIAQGLIRKFVIASDGEPYYCSAPYRFVNLGAALFRREVFDRCGLFDPSLKFGEDFDLIIRCWEQAILKIEVPAVSLLYQRHESNMTNGKSMQELGTLRIYKRRLDRMRARIVDFSLIEKRGISFAAYIGRTAGPFDEGSRERIQL